MNIVLATDGNFVIHCATTIMSIVCNNHKAHFYILTDGLSQKNVDFLKRIADVNHSELDIVCVSLDKFKDFPMPSNKSTSHIKLATYYRLFVTELLPADCKKVIYMDCDIVVRKSLIDLWNTDLNNYALGAVYQICNWNCSAAKRLGYDCHYGYFNAGVLLINLEYWRRNNVLVSMISYLRNNADKIVYHDQDVLNAVLHENTLRLPCKWNMLAGFYSLDIYKIDDVDESGRIIQTHSDYKKEIKSEKSNPTIIHYVSVPKPWSPKCTHPWRWEYNKYRNMTGDEVKVSLYEYFYFYCMRFYLNMKSIVKWILLNR